MIHTIETPAHGRYLVDRPELPRCVPLIVGFHGYGETAETMMENLRAVAADGAEDSDGWCVVSVQALHRFYTRKQEIVASWMTRQDRELEIASNTGYAWSVIRAVEREYRTRRPLVFAGFSQGVAMAYRAAVAGPCDGLVLLAGDVPPDVAPHAARLPPVLLGRGAREQWYTDHKAAADIALLRGAGVAVTEHVFDAGHVWDPSFTAAARAFLRSRAFDERERMAPTVRLRALGPDDEEAVYVLLSDERVVRCMLFPIFDRDRARSFTERFQSDRPSGSPPQVVLAVAADGVTAPVGLCGLVLDGEQQQGEAWYLVHPDRWDRGMGTAAVRALVDHAFGSLKLHRVWARCLPENPASARVLEKLGFRREGVHRSDLRIHGAWRDSVTYALLAHEWPADRLHGQSHVDEPLGGLRS